MNLALFDFDGTITKNDSLIEFIKFAVGNSKFLKGLLLLSPILILYKLKLIPNYKAKQKMLSWYFKGYTENEFKKIAKEYSLQHIDKIIRPKALEKLKFHKAKGHNIVIVSASIECWLYPWCKKNGYDLISTQLEIKDNVITGNFSTRNCYGEEKVNRIKKIYNLDSFEYIYAYGDSSGDKEMLELANESFYKPFT